MGRQSFVVGFVLLLVAMDTAVIAEKEVNPWVEKSFVILKSTSSYTEALSFATAAAPRLGAELNLRELSSDRHIGLTFPKALCEEEWGQFPCYLPRGRWDDGVYLSIEHSSGYKGFSPNLYIVIMAHGSKGDSDVHAAFVRARKVFPDAYVKTTSVYMGCMH